MSRESVAQKRFRLLSAQVVIFGQSAQLELFLKPKCTVLVIPYIYPILVQNDDFC